MSAPPAPPAPVLPVLYEDADLIAVAKPAGITVIPARDEPADDCLQARLAAARGERLWIVHRIDRDTSGLLVFAHTPDANRALGARFAAHDIERAYTTVVAGEVAGEARTIDRPVRGKRAVSHVRVVARLPDATRLEVRLETGRSHQIRLHLAGEGHPVLGDVQHGGERARTFPRRPPRLALHAGVLGFVHPRTGEPVRFDSPLPDDLTAWLATLAA